MGPLRVIADAAGRTGLDTRWHDRMRFRGVMPLDGAPHPTLATAYQPDIPPGGLRARSTGPYHWFWLVAAGMG
jgi:hypothetical protein